MTARRIAALLAIVIASVGSIVPVAAIAQTDEAAAERAAREIQDARDQANEAAEAFFEAESDLDVLQDEVGRLERDTVQLQAVVDRLRRDVESVAVSRFVSSGASGIPLLTGIQAPQDQVQAEVFVDVLTNSGGDALDAYDIAQKQLVTNQSELADRKRDIEAQQMVFVALQKQAEDEVVRLRAFEEERLQDEAVQRALDARIAADRVELEEQARREAEAAARAIPDPAVGLPTTTTTLVPPPTTGPDELDTDDAGGDAETGVATETTTTAPPETAPPTTAAPTNDGASGGTSGGRTGTGGSGSNPSPIDTGSTYLDTIICPMPGSAFADTWGAPRSGGRSHQGVDMIAPRGIPIYAVTSGFVTFKSNRLGGNAVSLVGDNGNRYYYAHLDGYEGISRTVSQGEIIGYNGDTGNARFSTPHLHFEIRPGGGLPTNPYPTVRAAGC
jgi:murein DD-endopeptidase MepM/ murein hydrolase activator NlpD